MWKNIFSCLFISLLLNEHEVRAIRCPDVAFVVHSNNANDAVSAFMANTFLRDTNLIIVSGFDTFDKVVESRRKLNLRKVRYDGNPGGFGNTYRTGGRKYLGTHRTMAGILFAMDSFPHAEWVYVLDDDNVVNVDAVCSALLPNNSSIPLLLGLIGPKRVHAPCRPTSTPLRKKLVEARKEAYSSLYVCVTEWTCCTDVKKPCLANISTPFESAHFIYDETLKTMVPKKCTSSDPACCEVVPWLNGVAHGYPYRLRRHEDAEVSVTFPTHNIDLWPYGGSTYALSKAMLHAVGRNNWERYMHTLMCNNADINVMNTVLSHGYSIHQYDHVFHEGFAIHHVHTIEEQFSALSRSRQPKNVMISACSYPDIKTHVSGKLHDIMCKRL